MKVVGCWTAKFIVPLDEFDETAEGQVRVLLIELLPRNGSFLPHW